MAIICLANPVQAVAQEASGAQPTRVEITGDRAGQSNVERRVIRATEIAKFNSQSVSEVLGRVPSMTVERTRSGAVELRLRGLSTAYLQVLVDGVAVAAGFDIDSVSTADIERIEIETSPSTSVTGIGGTLNIVLRKRLTSDRTTISTTAQVQNSAFSPSVSFNSVKLVGENGRSWGLLIREIRTRGTDVLQQIDQDSSSVVGSHQTISGYRTIARVASATSQQDFKRGETETSVQIPITYRYLSRQGYGTTSIATGPGPKYPTSSFLFTNEAISLAPAVSTSTPVTESANFEGRLSLSLTHALAARDLTAFRLQALVPDVSALRTRRNEATLGINGEVRESITSAVTVAAGWEAFDGRRLERYDDSSSSTPFPLDTMDAFHARLTKGASYLRTRFSISNETSAVLQLRVDAVRIDASSSQVAELRRTYKFMSPSVSLNRDLNAGKTAIKISLGGQTKSPTLVELSLRPYQSANNVPTDPDTRGNPALRPERAGSAEVTLSHEVEGGTSMRLAVAAKRIYDPIVFSLSNQQGRWLREPTNAQLAEVVSFEAEAKQKLAGTTGDSVELFLSVNVNDSRVTGLPALADRLDGQLPWSGKAGISYGGKGPLTAAGLSFSWQSASRAGHLGGVVTQARAGGGVDLYANYRITEKERFKFTATDLFRKGSLETTTYTSPNSRSQTRSRAPQFVALRVGWELDI